MSQNRTFCSCCRTKPGKLTRAASEVTAIASTNEGQETYFLGSIHCDDTEPAWPVNLDIGGKQISFKIDSGADTTVMAEGTYRTLLQRPELQETSSKLKRPGG